MDHEVRRDKHFWRHKQCNTEGLRAWIRQVTNKPVISKTETQSSFLEMRKPSVQHSISKGFMAEWQAEVITHWKAKDRPQTQTRRSKIPRFDGTQIELFWHHLLCLDFSKLLKQREAEHHLITIMSTVKRRDSLFDTSLDKGHDRGRNNSNHVSTHHNQ